MQSIRKKFSEKKKKTMKVVSLNRKYQNLFLESIKV